MVLCILIVESASVWKLVSILSDGTIETEIIPITNLEIWTFDIEHNTLEECESFSIKTVELIADSDSNLHVVANLNTVINNFYHISKNTSSNEWNAGKSWKIYEIGDEAYADYLVYGEYGLSAFVITAKLNPYNDKIYFVHGRRGEVYFATYLTGVYEFVEHGDSNYYHYYFKSMVVEFTEEEIHLLIFMDNSLQIGVFIFDNDFNKLLESWELMIVYNIGRKSILFNENHWYVLTNVVISGARLLSIFSINLNNYCCEISYLYFDLDRGSYYYSGFSSQHQPIAFHAYFDSNYAINVHFIVEIGQYQHDVYFTKQLRIIPSEIIYITVDGFIYSGYHLQLTIYSELFNSPISQYFEWSIHFQLSINGNLALSWQLTSGQPNYTYQIFTPEYNNVIDFIGLNYSCFEIKGNCGPILYFESYFHTARLEILECPEIYSGYGGPLIQILCYGHLLEQILITYTQGDLVITENLTLNNNTIDEKNYLFALDERWAEFDEGSVIINITGVDDILPAQKLVTVYKDDFGPELFLDIAPIPVYEEFILNINISDSSFGEFAHINVSIVDTNSADLRIETIGRNNGQSDPGWSWQQYNGSFWIVNYQMPTDEWDEFGEGTMIGVEITVSDGIHTLDAYQFLCFKDTIRPLIDNLDYPINSYYPPEIDWTVFEQCILKSVSISFTQNSTSVFRELSFPGGFSELNYFEFKIEETDWNNFSDGAINVVINCSDYIGDSIRQFNIIKDTAAPFFDIYCPNLIIHENFGYSNQSAQFVRINCTKQVFNVTVAINQTHIEIEPIINLNIVEFNLLDISEGINQVEITVFSEFNNHTESINIVADYMLPELIIPTTSNTTLKLLITEQNFERIILTNLNNSQSLEFSEICAEYNISSILPVDDGDCLFEFVVFDLAGNILIETENIIIDRTPPEFFVSYFHGLYNIVVENGIPVKSGNSILIDPNCLDHNSFTARIFDNSTLVFETGGIFELVLPELESKPYLLEISCFDFAFNNCTVYFEIEISNRDLEFAVFINKLVSKSPPTFGYNSDSEIYLNSSAGAIAFLVESAGQTAFYKNKSTGEFLIPYWDDLQNGSHKFKITAYDIAGNKESVNIFLERDCKPPIITIKLPTVEEKYYSKNIIFDFDVIRFPPNVCFVNHKRGDFLAPGYRQRSFFRDTARGGGARNKCHSVRA